MALGSSGDLVEKVERSAKLRFWLSVMVMVVTAFAIVLLISRDVSFGLHEAKDMFQIVGTSIIGAGIVVGLLTGKAVASITALISRDDEVKKLKIRYEKKLTIMSDFSALLVLIGTFASGYSVTLG